ncbi:hypothetical protein BD309DRAFT_962004 [Dichomitus squalens]|uniref:Uncharacterized protein n=2 Tax=Dichomitus squalens TaxID=114155 RepID=A0A4Q9Q3S8_9APHY|nr:uncharacterized protein DICSQDRAFT_141108 [Dichomitus squalens LYAD-421 SS1]EJF56663.1 hypothetical protein DICSQDRAFT_141108 [Dichomitus squalens LYAD-421 SS1]TBU26033.1 hypothetical protein BD311DRAFT_763514 [Dichomitus squalens]TBU42881.1 hypothetical protein BD309DRAFT_962004 [Dichomitus squalens]TBU61825.1 hypothetical protein BD310DRAFT_147585 [Dichomitus squalens]
MKSFVALAALAASAFAQRIQIGVPANLAEIQPGSNITVEVDRPNSLTGSTEVALAIGLFPCGGVKGATSCSSMDVSQVLGNVVYNGPYNPQYATDAPSKPPHQNFSVTVPSTFQSGQVSLGVAHFSLVGAGQSPLYEFVNVTLVVP